MQITEPTAQWIAEKMNFKAYKFNQLTKPEINISMGTWYLAYLLNLYSDDETLALCAYNAGRGNVDQWLKNPLYSSDGRCLQKIPFPETESYIHKIERYRRIYKFLYPAL